MLGRAKKVTATKDDTILLDGGGEKSSIKAACDQLREEIKIATSDYDRSKLQECLTKLSGCVAVLKIGGASEVEVSEKKDRVTDALNATKAAVEDGIVPGGGIALLHASSALAEVKSSLETFHQQLGLGIVEKTLKVPAKTIADNAGVEGSVVVEKILESGDPNFGYDAAADRYSDLTKWGIIDPLKVVCTALVDAASVASLITTSEAVVVEAPEDKKSAPGGAGGYPGGMKDMDYALWQQQHTCSCGHQKYTIDAFLGFAVRFMESHSQGT
ncbi:unnamed protein product [Ostreobium quekettii]|uniref:Uncharacterized protein n=1 Tax=Ostreobium quekettii TaxID=121088 RepID=A0A8S1J9V3_9CHLO|nr:unnamed protein product [Ostreobium quekettii]|eukprot:evm.model.scf_1082.2 EVM.evm.TU.scf_1082.2   scf_1082:12316-13980(-)